MRRLPVLRASASKRWLRCTWFSSQQWPDSPSGPEAQAGTRVHNGIAKRFGAHVEGDMPANDRERALVDAGVAYATRLMEANPGWTLHVEFTLEWASVSGQDEVVGHADLILVSPDGQRAIIVDWKTGRMHDGYDEQLSTYAWLVRFHHGVRHVTVVLAFLAEGTEVVREMDVDDIDEHSIDMMQALSRRSEEPAMPNPGAWCQWCPASLSCPKNDAPAAALSKSSPRGEIDVRKLSEAVTTAVDAAQAHAFIAFATEALARIESNLKAYARANGPVRTLDGNTYQASKQTRRTIDVTPECVAVLKAYGIDHVVEPTTTWASVKKAAGKDKATIAALETELFAAGALRSTEYETWTTK
jgi:hypothetical protein